MTITVTINEIIDLFRKKLNAEDDDDFAVEIAEQPIASIETFGLVPWATVYEREDRIYAGLDEDVREAVGYKIHHEIEFWDVDKRFLQGKISWDIFNRFIKYMQKHRRGYYTSLYEVITAVEIYNEPVSLATAARYLQCSDTYLRNRIKGGSLKYIPNTKQLSAETLIELHGGKYVDGVLGALSFMPEKVGRIDEQ